jgi:flagellar protein FliL
MSAPAPAANATPKKGGKKKLMMMVVVALSSIGGGVAMPMVMGSTKTETKKVEKKHDHHMIALPFGDVTVNLAEERMTRYLRLKIVLKVEGPKDEAEGAAHLARFKPAMKSWLISHVAGKTLKEVSGTVGVKRLQKEFLEKFEEFMDPDHEHEHAMVASTAGAAAGGHGGGHGGGDTGHAKKCEHFVIKDVMFEEYVVQ